ncbi:MBL fold metallo-hydrolase [bacterium]|nr:MBL fold metallo-hydrolase [bacterium]MBU1883142.1 MBL fold metallo-hydrolase [bacterium]
MNEKEKILYDDGTHKFVMFNFDDEAHEDSFLSVNQYLIVQNGAGVLIDPGSEAIFDELSEAVSRHVDIADIKFIFLSHQDPDVSSSITQWSITTQAKFIMSGLWVRFMSHYGFMELSRIMSLPDRGAKINFGKDYLRFLPAHFLHSPGNFSLYDSRSKILFSGDIGAAIIASPDDYKHVEDFEEHKQAMLGFHKRYMGSNRVCRAWVGSVRKLDIDKIAPQHGFIFEGENVPLFLNWFEELKCGSDFLEELY